MARIEIYGEKNDSDTQALEAFCEDRGLSFVTRYPKACLVDAREFAMRHPYLCVLPRSSFDASMSAAADLEALSQMAIQQKIGE